ELVFRLVTKINFACRDLSVVGDNNQPIDIGARYDEITIRTLPLNYLSMLGFCGSYSLPLEPAVLNELADRLVITLLAKHGAPSNLRQFSRGILQFDPKQRTIRIRFDCVPHYQTFEHGRVLGLRLITQLDLDFLARLEKLGVAQLEFPFRGVAI